MIDAVPDSPAGLFLMRDDALDRRPHRGPHFPAVEGQGKRQLQRAQCGENLLRLALGHATGTPPGTWGIGHTPSGRPVVTGGPDGSGRMHVSLAHSGPFVVAAASASGLLAVDLEVMRERRTDASPATSTGPDSGTSLRQMHSFICGHSGKPRSSSPRRTTSFRKPSCLRASCARSAPASRRSPGSVPWPRGAGVARSASG